MGSFDVFCLLLPIKIRANFQRLIQTYYLYQYRIISVKILSLVVHSICKQQKYNATEYIRYFCVYVPNQSVCALPSVVVLLYILLAIANGQLHVYSASKLVHLLDDRDCVAPNGSFRDFHDVLHQGAQFHMLGPPASTMQDNRKGVLKL